MESRRLKICKLELATPQLQNSEQKILILNSGIDITWVDSQKLPNNSVFYCPNNIWTIIHVKTWTNEVDIQLIHKLLILNKLNNRLVKLHIN
jgi:hypothetical protein